MFKVFTPTLNVLASLLFTHLVHHHVSGFDCSASFPQNALHPLPSLSGCLSKLTLLQSQHQTLFFWEGFSGYLCQIVIIISFWTFTALSSRLLSYSLLQRCLYVSHGFSTPLVYKLNEEGGCIILIFESFLHCSLAQYPSIELLLRARFHARC